MSMKRRDMLREQVGRRLRHERNDVPTRTPVLKVVVVGQGGWFPCGPRRKDMHAVRHHQRVYLPFRPDSPARPARVCGAGIVFGTAAPTVMREGTFSVAMLS